MSSSDLSVQLYTIRLALAEDRGVALSRLADLGFRNVELFDFVDQADAYVDLLRDRGLAAPSGHAMLIGEDVGKVFDAAQTIGVRTVIQPMVAVDRWTDLDGVVGTARALNEIAEKAADRGLVVGYHNHWWELESRIGGTAALELFAEHLDDAVVLEVDTYWAEVGGVGAVELLRRLGDRVRFLHVKDGPATKVTLDQVAVGSGGLDVLSIMAAAPGALRVVELDDCAGDVFDALRDSLAYLTAHGVSA
jgi:sugar phosphate isomerase/epimerase